MMESVQTDGKRGENRYFKAPVFAVAPMIDWTDKPESLGVCWPCRTARRTGLPS